MNALYIIFGAVVILMLLTLLAAFITYRMAFYRNPKRHICDPYYNIDKGNYAKYESVSRGLIDNVLTLPCEEITTLSRDGLKLSGRYYETRAGAPLVIQFHGYKSTPMKDLSGAGVMSIEFGYNVIMVDQRAHGKSEGRTITFGHREKLDCLEWIRYAIERFGNDVKIAIQGISMGAATVLLAAGEDNLPNNLKGVMADCPFDLAREVLKSEIKKMGLPSWFFYPVLRLGAIIFGRFDPNKVTVSEGVRKANVPILLIHGTADGLVPYYMSENIAKTGKCQFETYEGADHGISYLIDTPRYKKCAKEFLEKIFE